MPKKAAQTSADINTYNSINSDWKGRRIVKQQCEDVDYRLNTTQRIWLNDLAMDFPSHWHSALEIIMPVENYYQVETNGSVYDVQPGEIFFIPPRELHSLYAPPTGKRFVFIMDISTICKMKGFVGISTILSSPLYITKDSYPMIYDDIYQIMVQIRNEYFKNSEYSELTILSLLLQLFVKIGENHNNSLELFPNTRPGKHKEYMLRFNQLLEYVDDHYMEDLNLDSVANMAGFSKFHFSRLFKQYTNFTFCDYLSYRRIKAAMELLSDPDYSITEAAMDSGFPSISTFNRLFKNQVGCTPREYRAKNTRKLY